MASTSQRSPARSPSTSHHHLRFPHHLHSNHAVLSNLPLSPLPHPLPALPSAPLLRHNDHHLRQHQQQSLLLPTTTHLFPLQRPDLSSPLPQMPHRPHTHLLHHQQRLHGPARTRLPRRSTHNQLRRLKLTTRRPAQHIHTQACPASTRDGRTYRQRHQLPQLRERAGLEICKGRGGGTEI